MKRVPIEVKKRDVKKKSMLNNYRRQGLIPAVAYGEGIDPTPIVLNRKDFLRTLRTEGVNVIFDLTLDGKGYPSIIKELQKDPVKDTILHIDFMIVDINKPVTTVIPVETTGTSKGEKLGGLLEQELYELEVEALPLDLPDKVVVDVTDLGMHDVVFVKDLNISDKVKVLTHPDTPVVSVVAPAREEVPAAVEGEEVEAAEGEEKKEEAAASSEEKKE
ncbi:MAG: 50S ribosomal protein L25 [Caldisericaceae bacterium]|nr:50S ribosomal protein L25 [Caldisericaceae bacterium]